MSGSHHIKARDDGGCWKSIGYIQDIRKIIFMDWIQGSEGNKESGMVLIFLFNTYVDEVGIC